MSSSQPWGQLTARHWEGLLSEGQHLPLCPRGAGSGQPGPDRGQPSFSRENRLEPSLGLQARGQDLALPPRSLLRHLSCYDQGFGARGHSAPGRCRWAGLRQRSSGVDTGQALPASVCLCLCSQHAKGILNSGGACHRKSPSPAGLCL